MKIPGAAEEVGADAHPACAPQPQPQPAPGAALAQTRQVKGGPCCLLLGPEDLRWARRVPERGHHGPCLGALLLGSWLRPGVGGRGFDLEGRHLARCHSQNTWPTRHTVPTRTVSSDAFVASREKRRAGITRTRPPTGPPRAWGASAPRQRLCLFWEGTRSQRGSQRGAEGRRTEVCLPALPYSFSTRLRTGNHFDSCVAFGLT